MSDKMSEVDWANDEAVVRAAHANNQKWWVYVSDEPAQLGKEEWPPRLEYWVYNNSLPLGHGITKELAWSSARQHPTVANFERDNRPVIEVEAAKKYIPWTDAGGPNECMHGYAEGIPCPDCDAASKLTPAAVAGDAVKEISDTARLNWLADNEAHLCTHREKLGYGYGIWWNVVKRGKSISGHPLGSPRTAIDAAMQRKAAKESRKA